jgi:hypothetical protein
MIVSTAMEDYVVKARHPKFFSGVPEGPRCE